jgi:dihydrofolate reductase
MRKLKYFVASSLDNYIASADGSFDWLFSDQDYGMTEFFANVDLGLIGRKTWDQMKTLDWSLYKAFKNYVFSRTESPGERAGVEFTRESPVTLVEREKKKPGKDIWLCGGATLAHPLLEAKLIDDFIVAVHPIMIGDGIPLFPKPYSRHELKLIKCKPYETGLVHLFYEVKR